MQYLWSNCSLSQLPRSDRLSHIQMFFLGRVHSSMDQKHGGYRQRELSSKRTNGKPSTFTSECHVIGPWRVWSRLDGSWPKYRNLIKEIGSVDGWRELTLFCPMDRIRDRGRIPHPFNAHSFEENGMRNSFSLFATISPAQRHHCEWIFDIV